MNARLLCTALSLIACASCSVLRSEGESEPGDFKANIARIERSDPTSPGVLIARLGYAEFLLKDAPGPCAQRLEQTQEQLASVNADPKARVMFPDGWPRAADIEYRLHLARADCGSEAERDNELRAAVVAARRAVELYRNEYDYHAMVTMQFNVGVVLHRLCDKEAALAALKAALDMDREFGFVDDAHENYELFLSWQGKPAGEAQVFELMRDFPKLQVVLQFGWHPIEAQVSLESHRESLEHGQVVRSRAAADFERQIVADTGGGWNVSYAQRLTRYDPGVWPVVEDPQQPSRVFPAVPLPAGFKVSPTGEFAGVTDSTEFAARLVAKTHELIRAAAPSDDNAPALVAAAVDATTVNFSPGMLEAAAAESYQLETAMWIGATLDQGVWHEISASLSVPGMPHVVVQNRVEFAFTRLVPCTVGAGAKVCVEIVIRARPEQDALRQVMADFRLPAPFTSGLQGYIASTEARIVIEPGTLLPYSREERRYWYASIGKDPRDTTLHSEHLVFTTK
jgi:hypothetical protein